MKLEIDIPYYIFEQVKRENTIKNVLNRIDFAVRNGIERQHGECKTCKHFVKGGLDGKTYVCEHPDIVLDDHFDYACIEMNEDDFCSRYVPREGDPDDRA